MRAVAWNFAGRVAFNAGSALHRLGLALCGLAGDLDARADSAGYWDHHTAALDGPRTSGGTDVSG